MWYDSSLSGIVMKPERLKDSSLRSIIQATLELKLISGQNLGHLIEDSNTNQNFVYIELEVVDMYPGLSTGMQNSSVAQFNLLHPIWQDTPTFNFKVKYLDCAILFIRVECNLLGN